MSGFMTMQRSRMSGWPHARGALARLVALVAILGATASAHAQAVADWPTKPVRLVIAVGAGGAADTLARNIANGFQARANGQPLIIENRAGAGGTTAAAGVAREAPDGYTLFLAEVGPNTVAHAMMKLPYDPATAFTPIIHAANLPSAFLIRADLPYKTLPEFIAAAKAQPSKFNSASAGVGNWTHLFAAYLNGEAGIEQVNVTFRSGAEMLTALIRGDADTAVLTVSTALGQIRDGKVRALGGLGSKPITDLPGVAPVGATLAGFDAAVWHGVVGPAGMDPALVMRINGIFNDILADPVIRKPIIEAQSAEIVGGTPAQFDAFIKSELQRWPALTQKLGIKPPN